MPEGDTVWRVARQLDAALAGRVLTSADLRVPALATVDLAGRGVLGVVPRGKHLLTRVEPDLTLHTHLRMDGAWQLYRPGQRWSGGPAHQVRVVLATSEWVAVGFRLPVVELLPTREEHRAVGHLGPDLLGPDWDAAEAVRRLRERPERAVGEALLDQRTLAGIGAIYRAESLFLEGVSPWTPVGAVPRLEVVVERAHQLLLLNRDRPTQVTTGDPRRGREHWVHGRAGRPCRRCGTVVASAAQGTPPYARTVTWCPTCQPEVSSATG
jgi:endonuclease-8